MIEIFAIKLAAEEKFGMVKPLLLEHLPDNVVEKLKRFRYPRALQRNMLGEILCRAVLAGKQDIPVKSVRTFRTEKGKPHYTDYPQWHFNISHSADWVILGFSDGEIGIDIEKPKPVNYRLARRFFSEEENEKLETLEEPHKLRYFFDLWTLKESYLKYLGKGLTKPLNTFTIHDSGGRFFLKHDQDHVPEVHFQQFDVAEDYKAALCTEAETPAGRIRYLVTGDLLKMINR